MAYASAPSSSPSTRVASLRKPPSWRRLLGRLGRRGGPFAPPWTCTCFEDDLEDEEACEDSCARACAEVASTPPTGLRKARRASAAELARIADALELGAACVELGPVSVKSLIAETVGRLTPVAERAGLRLLHDTQSHADGLCCADPERLRRVLDLLILRALAAEREPGHVRIMVTLSPRQAQIRILARRPEAPGSGEAETDDHDLSTAHRVVRAMGGWLALEPQRAGYWPLCIGLRALSPAPPPRDG